MPKNGKEGVTVSLDSDLIDIVDYFAARLDINRSEATKQALKMWAAQQAQNSPEFWDRLSYGVHNRSKQKFIF